jgi:hypothetical protein
LVKAKKEKRKLMAFRVSLIGPEESRFHSFFDVNVLIAC